MSIRIYGNEKSLIDALRNTNISILIWFFWKISQCEKCTGGISSYPVHDRRPSFHSHTLKYSEHSVANIVKACDSWNSKSDFILEKSNNLLRWSEKIPLFGPTQPSKQILTLSSQWLAPGLFSKLHGTSFSFSCTVSPVSKGKKLWILNCGTSCWYSRKICFQSLSITFFLTSLLPFFNSLPLLPFFPLSPYLRKDISLFLSLSLPLPLSIFPFENKSKLQNLFPVPI